MIPEGGDSIFLTRPFIFRDFHPHGPNSFTLLLLRCFPFRDHRSKAKVYFCVRTGPLGPCLATARFQFDVDEVCVFAASAWNLPPQVASGQAICPAQQDFLGFGGLKRLFRSSSEQLYQQNAYNDEDHAQNFLHQCPNIESLFQYMRVEPCE